jgi:hypothetical protein
MKRARESSTSPGGTTPFSVPDDRGGQHLKKIDLKEGRTRSKPFRCIETEKTYNSQAEAAEELGLSQPQVWAALKSGRPSFNGYTFEFMQRIDHPGEIWKPLGDPPSWLAEKRGWNKEDGRWELYIISNQGRICAQGSTPGPCTARGDGYYQVGVGRLKWQAHVLVYMTFGSAPIPKGYVIDHIDRNKGNNRIENLQ